MAAKRRRLAERRKSLGYSQESFAEDVGVDRSTVGRWEGGETEPLPFIRPKLCRVLKVTPDELGVLLTPSAAELASPSTQVVVGRVVPEPQPNAAETALAEALRNTISLRRQGGILADLAMLGVCRRDVDQILHHAGQAVDLAQQTQSAGYVGRKLRSLQPRLTPFLKDTRVNELNSRITQLSSPA